MLIDKLSLTVKTTIKIALLIVLFVAAICIIPIVFVWCVNSLAEAGNADFYIEHTLWNYFLALIFIILMRGK